MSTKIRLADYLLSRLSQLGIEQCFLVTGGGAMHLNDAIGRCPAINYTPCHHEQTCAMAAESYNRLSGKVALVNVTTGPGGTNAITGIHGAYTDSLAVFVVSGQVKRETLICNSNAPQLRQLGDQEIDIITMVKTITKYAHMVVDAESIRYHIERAWYLATHGRPGPVWLDIPIDVQSTMIDPLALKGYDPSEDQDAQCPFEEHLESAVDCALQKLTQAKRPVILVGSGVRISQTQKELLNFLNQYPIPVVTGWNAHDVVHDEHPQYAGRPGTIGNRAGNFAVQNSDCVLVLGSRLNIRQISYNWKSFAKHAYKIMVDIDALEMHKPTLNIDMPIHADLRSFFRVAAQKSIVIPMEQKERLTAWIKQCKEWMSCYPVVLKDYWSPDAKINPYCFVNTLFEKLNPDDVVVCGDGTACVVTFQAAHLKEGQRLYTNSGCASMGYDLPAAIGAAYAAPEKPYIICLAGDGSIQMNLQDLQTIVANRLPIKIFVLNNNGYHSIRQTQQNFFHGNMIGCNADSKLFFPSFEKLATAYEIPFVRYSSHKDLEQVSKSLLHAGPYMIEVMLDEAQGFSPKLASRKNDDGTMSSPELEDMFPFLSREELAANMPSEL